MITIKGGRILTPVEQYHPGTIIIENGKIKSVGYERDISIPAGSAIIDAKDKIISPGFIDVHTHGLLGNDVMGAGLAKAIPLYPQFGVTSFMATTITLEPDEARQMLDEMVAILKQPPKGANCLGIHLEGPYLYVGKPGMATADWFYPLSREDFQRYQKNAGGRIKMVTFAPELAGAMAVIPYLVEQGVTPVIGHSNATFDQVSEAVKYGLNHATHTFNAMGGLNHREPGTVGGVLYHDKIYAELVGDGIHVHPAVMQILVRTKGIERTVLVSDSSPFGAMPEGKYEWEHKPLVVKDGVCRLLDGTIAGAHAQIDAGLRNLVNLLHMPLEKALVTVTMTPAASVNLKNKGKIAAGYDADIVMLNDALMPVFSMVGGEIVWQA